MIRQVTLTSKQHDLSLCILARELKLRELYHATGIYQSITSGHNTDVDDAIKHWGNGEGIFLEANNIAEGRFLDLSTLPSVHGKISTQSQLRTNPKPPLLRRLSANSTTNREPANLGYRDISKKGENGSSQQGDPAKGSTSDTSIIPVVEKPLSTSDESRSQKGGAQRFAAQDHNDVTASLSAATEGDLTRHIVPVSAAHPHLYVSSAADLAPKSLESGLNRPTDVLNSMTGIKPSVALPLTSDDAGCMPELVVAALASHQTSLNPRIVHLPSQEVQQARLVQVSPREHLNAEMEEALPKEQIEPRPQPDDADKEQLVEDVGQTPSQSSTMEKGATQGAHNEISSGLKTPGLAQSSAESFEVAPLIGPADNSTFPKLQSGTGRFDHAFISAPATPDEQLRLEEAQSMQKLELSSSSKFGPTHDQGHPNQGPQASLTSDFVHGGIDEEDSHSSASKLATGNGVGHHSTINRVLLQHEHDQHATKPIASLRDRAFSGIAGESSKDLTLSRRPPMRIDTGVSSISEPIKPPTEWKTVTPNAGNPYTPVTSSTPNRSSSTAQAHSPPERMTTRVSSGARRHKSVSEILGETPKATPHAGDKSFPDQGQNAMVHKDASIHTPKIPLSAASADSAAFRLRLNELKGKEKSKLSSVVFARKNLPNSPRNLEPSQLQSSDSEDVHLRNTEYLQPLFAMQATAATHSRHLHALISLAHKTLSTSNHYTNFHEQQDCRILERIFHLQTSNGWSLRQLARSDEPERPISHRDVLLSHAKWMATDFREERKWKIAAAKGIADSCAGWVNGSSDDRRLLQIKTRPVSAKPEAEQQFTPTPELIPSTGDDLSVTEVVTPHHEASYGTAPAAIFSTAPEMFCFGADKSAVTQKLLLELPLYQPCISDEAPDSAWRTPIVPLSKFAQGKMVSNYQGPPRKRSRYNYDDADMKQRHGISELFQQNDMCNVSIGPEQENVALLNPDNKHIRDRIHAGHAFRPPSEHVMPSQSFFECRQPSQWTQGEDDELRKLVREYAYNWSLISNCLESSSIFSSGAERRTPWECFERWISLEGLPAEMSKTQYFRAYHSRLQAAQKTHEAQQQALQQHQGSNTPHLPMRRRTTQPYLVDRRKNDKHLRMLEAMRKLAKKRETALHKQQHVAGLAAMRKANEAVQPRAAMHTPQEFSRVKYERECKMQESAKVFRAQMLQQQKAAHAQKTAQQSGQPAVGPPGMPPVRPSAPNGTGPNPIMNSSVSNIHPQTSQLNQPRPPPRPVNGSQPNGLHAVPGNPHTIPHAPMQTHPMQQRMQPQMSSDNMRIYHEATRVQAEQQRFLLHQRQQQLPHTNGQATTSASPNMGSLKSMSQSNPAMLPSLHGRSSSPSATVGGPAPTGSSSSPRMTTTGQAQSLSSGLVPAVNEISNQIKSLHPNASPEQLKRMTTDALIKFRNNHAAQAAMHAAAGTNASLAGSNMNMPNLPTPPPPTQPMNGVNRSPPLYNPQQQYSQILRNQQSSQQSRNTAPGMGATRPASRCGTPQMHRSGSMQGVTAPGQSPRPGPAQIAGPQ